MSLRRTSNTGFVCQTCRSRQFPTTLSLSRFMINLIGWVLLIYSHKYGIWSTNHFSFQLILFYVDGCVCIKHTVYLISIFGTHSLSIIWSFNGRVWASPLPRFIVWCCWNIVVWFCPCCDTIEIWLYMYIRNQFKCCVYFLEACCSQMRSMVLVMCMIFSWRWNPNFSLIHSSCILTNIPHNQTSKVLSDHIDQKRFIFERIIV